MANELSVVLEYIEREKGVDKAVVLEAVEAALMTAARKKYGEEASVAVTVDEKTGHIEVVKDGDILKSEDFGRIAAQTVRQIIMQKIREAEREVIFQNFQAKAGDITNGIVHRFDRGSLIVDLGKTEGVLSHKDLLPKEEYKQGSRVRALIVDVRKTGKGAQVILSRTHPDFVRRLFELEVPEIYEKIVTIKAIARLPGERTKIAVSSTDEKVDSVGACVGVRGARIKNIVRELHGEKVDIVRWSDSVEEFVRAAMNPAKLTAVDVFPDQKRIEIDVEVDFLSLAIGKRGQNVRLASQLMGWDITIRNREQGAVQNNPDRAASFSDTVSGEHGWMAGLPTLTADERRALENAGFSDMLTLAQTTAEVVVAATGIASGRVEEILLKAKELSEPENE